MKQTLEIVQLIATCNQVAYLFLHNIFLQNLCQLTIHNRDLGPEELSMPI